MPVHFGKKALKDTDELSNGEVKARYRKSRLEFFIEGSASNNGNAMIRLEYLKQKDTKIL